MKVKRLNDRKLRNMAHRIAAHARALNKRLGKHEEAYEYQVWYFRSVLGY